MDALQEILYSLRHNKLRTLLTAFGVFWGILMLVLLMAAGQSMQRGALKEFGTNVLDFTIIWTNSTSVAHRGNGVGRQIQLTENDVETIRNSIPGISVITAENSRGGITVVHEKKSGQYSVYGVMDDFFRIKEKLPFDAGRKLHGPDIDETRKVASIGRTVAERLFGNEVNAIGQWINVNGIMMRVISVFYDDNNQGRDSERIYIPHTTFKKMFNQSHHVGAVWWRPIPGADTFAINEKIIALLKERHNVAPEDRRAIQHFNMSEPAQRIHGMNLGMNILIWFVGLGTLMAGIVGVSNIMIITVKERTREIGIRKALGATPTGIVSTLLLESILVTLLAGYSGLVVAVGLVELVAYGMSFVGGSVGFFQSPQVDFGIALQSIILLVIVGALAGLMPALHAAKIAPIEAMRAD